jgi:uncharacterized UPF0146 family protein
LQNNIKIEDIMWQDFADYILNEAGNQEIRIAEIGVGKFDMIAEILSKEDNITVIKTDIIPDNSTVIKDDITHPNLELYKGVDIIYSIRPPSELQPHLVRLAQEIDSELVIKPLTNEDLNTGKVKMKLKNFKKASFYTLR